uniref:Aminotransferase-like plant mobile domain-containing protein n=1 Tax=Fagus sylvatica TaxID=28930 RepID=A0A2N9EMI7_FAGSY
MGEWDSFTTLVTWYKVHEHWSAWVTRLSPSMLDKWRKLGINEAIHTSKFELPMNPNLLTALILFWSPVTNTFSFPKAYMTPAVADVFALTCLPLVGASVHIQMAYGKGPEEDILIGVNLNYVPFIKSMKAPIRSSPMVDLCGSCRCGLIHTFQASLLNFTHQRATVLWGSLDARQVRCCMGCLPPIEGIGSNEGIQCCGGSLLSLAHGEEIWVVSSPSFQTLWEANMANFNNEDHLIEAIQGAGMEHITSYMAPTPLQQVSSTGKKLIGCGDSSSQKHIVDKAKEALTLQALVPQLPATSEQGIRTSTMGKTHEVEKVDPIAIAISTKVTKPSDKNQNVKTYIKKHRTIEVLSDSPSREDALIVDTVALVGDPISKDEAQRVSNLAKK